jgi:hypothetical protein
VVSLVFSAVSFWATYFHKMEAAIMLTTRNTTRNISSTDQGTILTLISSNNFTNPKLIIHTSLTNTNTHTTGQEFFNRKSLNDDMLTLCSVVLTTIQVSQAMAEKANMLILLRLTQC